MSNSRIAEKLGVDSRTIDREIKRNSGQRGYRFQRSHAKAVDRRRANSSKGVRLVSSLWEQIVELPHKGWSLEQIAGRHKREGLSKIGRTWIYHRIRLDRKRGGDLYWFLHQCENKKNWRGGRPAGCSLICRLIPDSRTARRVG